jgi:hypothetical protein
MIPMRRKYRSLIDSVFDDMAYGFDYFNYPLTSSYSFSGRIYDPDTHDLVPKESYKKEQLKLKEQRLEELKKRRENDNRLYEEQEKTLKLEIDELRQKLSP